MISRQSGSASEFFGPRTDILLIIGNGFDLDLGLKTGYNDFTHSIYWPFRIRKKDEGLGEFLENKRGTNNWFDLEEALEQYSINKTKEYTKLPNSQEFLERDKNDYISLVNALRDYLSSIDVSFFNRKSKAALLLQNCFESPLCPPTIYSFNYTDLSKICKAIDSDINYSPIYVHGTLKDGIILGMKDCDEVRGLSFMSKTHRPSYSHSGLNKAMDEAETIIFFGLSFGKIDYDIYFRKFFEGLSTTTNGNQKRIRIITKDEVSRQDIFSNICSTDALSQNHDFKIIKTDGDIEEFNMLNSVIINPPLSIDLET